MWLKSQGHVERGETWDGYGGVVEEQRSITGQVRESIVPLVDVVGSGECDIVAGKQILIAERRDVYYDRS